MNKSQLPSAEEWRQTVDGQASSGLTVAGYCRDRGITEGSFYTWKRRLRRPAQRNRSPKAAFVEVTPPRVETAGTIELWLPAGRCLLVRRGFDRELLVELIRALESIA